MAQIQFGDEIENVITRDEWPLTKAREALKEETIAVLGYGVQGPGQALNLRDNGFNVIVGQRKGSKTWDKALDACRSYLNRFPKGKHAEFVTNQVNWIRMYQF